MKNIFKILGLLAFLACIYSCEDVLDRKPLDKISDGDVWTNESLLDGYVIDLYSRLPSKQWVQEEWLFTDESTDNGSNDNSFTRGTTDKDNTISNLEQWDYKYIRDCNLFLEKIGAAPIAVEKKSQFEGEVRAMRAYTYFEMEKRYGGVPLVTTVIDPYGKIDPKDQMRVKEEEIYDFVNTEYDKAIQLLAGVVDVKPTARINKWTALALKARANLYAASIAKYGTVQLDGLVGVTSSRANELYKKASDAAKEVINSNRYSLYNKQADLAKNYQYIFLDAGNSEIMFAREYDGSNVKHTWDYDMPPRDFCSGMGHQCNPILNFILQYENIDGSVKDFTLLFNKDHLYKDALELFQGKDPRLFGTVLMQGSLFKNTVIQFYSGIDTALIPDPNKIVKNPILTYKGYSQVGTDSRLANEMNTNSDFLIRKFCDEPNLPIAPGTSQVDWPIMRLAEVYLTKAEADFQLGNITDAVTNLNMTRSRAGISLVNAGTINLQKIQNEWLVEFAFENKRFWDLRRWRIAESVLNTTQIKGLSAIWHFASNKYYFLAFNAEPFTRVFRPQQYYNPISTSRLNNNPLLKQNPLY
jgi:starch-binding outer membrane protein, SusD/RagB family